MENTNQSERARLDILPPMLPSGRSQLKRSSQQDSAPSKPVPSKPAPSQAESENADTQFETSRKSRQRGALPVAPLFSPSSLASNRPSSFGLDQVSESGTAANGEFHGLAQVTDEELEPSGAIYRLTRFFSGWATSFVIHTLLLIAFAAFSFGLGTNDGTISLTLRPSEVRELDLDIPDVKIDLDVSSLEEASPEELQSDELELLDDEVESFADQDFEPLDDIGFDSIVGSNFDADLSNIKKGAKTGASGDSANFFGIKASGQKFIFVIDCSGSMHGQRWQRAKYELEASIRELTDDQEFCIVLYNTFTVVMGNRDQIQTVPVTEENREAAFDWLNLQRPAGGTYPRQAMGLSLLEEPDAIFLLSDGEIKDNTKEFLQSENENIASGVGDYKRIPIHTIALLSTFGQQTLKDISDDSGGTFTRVSR